MSGYDDGMFAYSPDPMSEAEQFLFGERVAFHEAGHAVVGYALGLGCSRIEMRETIGVAEKTVGPAGCSYTSRSATARVNAILRRGTYHPLLAKHAICSAAGPAAELKYCHEVQVLPRVLHGSHGDHESIDGIAKRIEMVSNRNRFAFRELAWRGATRILGKPGIWDAIDHLASELFGLIAHEEDTPHDHSIFEILPGSTARAIMRRYGVAPGMFERQ